MTRYIYIILSCLILFLSGCNGPINSKEVNSKDHSQNNGFTQNLNEVVNVGEHKILIKRVLFDISALTLEYEVLEQLPSLDIVITSESKQRNTDRVSNFGEVSVDFPSDVCEAIVSFPHNLELVNQRVEMQVNIGDQTSEFFIDFPGEKLAQVTKVQYFNDSGEPVSDIKQAATKVIVALSYTEVESKNLGKDIVVLDLGEKRVLKRSMGSYAGGGDVIENFEPISMPRGNINIKLVPEDKLFIISY
ncbi:hypothetical protein [Desulfosporosinus meridiei]|uniref:Uncharacterized protein n=1 Tax=Desulfosporosinus meridiei (strain ATCC BAA-275 / DSM 13257 / KCTC 12902 / NCIMB 13706 / S10) TaxID=768704 RepID=J7IRA3_DESMD|nr:hypothetical protein [Desulfosporosinus meridiei]AFQ44362.1 hypothetical protein Desmer_2443 [Desulfosporosinus meridiei DSM 13257]